MSGHCKTTCHKDFHYQLLLLCVKVNVAEMDQFRMYTTIMQPFVEAYWVAACQLEKLLPSDQPCK